VRVAIHGGPGVGKSSFAAAAPAPLFIDADRRTGNLDVARVVPTSWSDILDTMRELCTVTAAKSEFATIVFDTLDAMEYLLHAELCAKHGCENIEQIAGGYGKGFVAAKVEWLRFAAGIEALRSVGFGVILIAHSDIRTFQNPDGENYDVWTMQLDKRAVSILRGRVDIIGFACHEDLARKKKGELKAKVVTTGERVLKFKHNPAYLTKQDMGVPDDIPLSWAEFAKYVNPSQEK